jgi:hypothetical protein
MMMMISRLARLPRAPVRGTRPPEGGLHTRLPSPAPANVLPYGTGGLILRRAPIPRTLMGSTADLRTRNTPPPPMLSAETP